MFEQDTHRDWLERTFQVTFGQVTECLRWAGQPTELGHVQCVQRVLVLAKLLEHLEERR